MNIEDAIRIIKGLDTSNSEENIEAKKMAVKALEKQRQKKIETWNGQASCPRCKKLFGEMKTIRNLTTWEMPYCKFVGRLLIGVMNSEKKYRHTLESCGNPAESKRTLCCYGRTSI